MVTVTLMLWVTWGAALKLALPDWLAAMMQVPIARPLTTLPDTVQMLVVFDVKTTGLLDAPPVADTIPVPPTVMLGAVPKVMVCGATGVTLPEGEDAAPGPTLLVALTVNV